MKLSTLYDLLDGIQDDMDDNHKDYIHLSAEQKNEIDRHIENLLKCLDELD